MSATTVRVMSSISAALAVYVVIALVTPLEIWIGIPLAGLSAAAAWFVAAKVAGSNQPPNTHRTASGITGNNVKIEDIKADGGSGSTDTASDIHGTGDVTIRRIEDERGQP